ncbi:Rap1a/Tai family immunity protein [Ideonella lacteola]|uniref:Rap1a/Tai family immunity protein n=1 Tax=Ideonella lacteola TaxID=2984193 RepID=UPI003BF9D521
MAATLSRLPTRRALCFVVTALVLGTAGAEPRAFFKDGNALLAGLSAPASTSQNGFAIGYVIGTVEALNEEQQLSFKVCFKIPSNATQRQLSDIVKQYLEQFPTVRDLPAPWLVASSLERIFPCAKQPSARPQ